MRLLQPYQNKIDVLIAVSDWDEFSVASVPAASKENFYQSQGMDFKVSPRYIELT